MEILLSIPIPLTVFAECELLLCNVVFSFVVKNLILSLHAFWKETDPPT